jgi:NADPH-dependent 2,4-dienoyl-CoA reductase/sulfur reductase-like enzyme
MCARSADQEADITVLSRERYYPYRRSMLSSVIAIGASSPRDISMCAKQLNRLNIRYQTHTDVRDLNPGEREVTIQDVNTGKKSVLGYDSIVLATGGFAAVPKIRGVEKKGVLCLRFFEDAMEILRKIRPGCNAVIVGAGFAGLEIAEALMRQGVRVKIVVRSRILRDFVEPSLSEYLKKQIEQKGVEVITGFSPTEICGTENVEYVKLENDTRIPASIIAFVTGVKPNVELGTKAGVELGETGAFRVDDHMKTSLSNVYSAGDCAEALDAISGIWTYYPVGSVAAREGSVAGKNAGGEDAKFDGVIRTQMDVIFGQGIASIGLGSESAKDFGMKISLVDLSLMKNRFKFLEDFPAKLLVAIDPKDRIVGAQVISTRFTPQYACTMLWAIQRRLNLNDFLRDWQPTMSAYTRIGKR